MFKGNINQQKKLEIMETEKIIANEFAMFNREFPHQFIQCENSNETISIRTKNGKRITISVIEMANCVDIAYHDSPIEPIINGSKDIPQFEIIGFNCGSTPIQRTPITIATIML